MKVIDSNTIVNRVDIRYICRVLDPGFISADPKLIRRGDPISELTWNKK